MEKTLSKLLNGYQEFRSKYATGENSVLQQLAEKGQKPQTMIVACCDSRVDPALILQCEPGDLFTVRNVANIIPPYEHDDSHHGTSAALEFGICYLNIKHLIILGHSQCGGIEALLNADTLGQNDFITNWVSAIKLEHKNAIEVDHCVKRAIQVSYRNCFTFPWIKDKVEKNLLAIHQWFFDIKEGKIYAFSSKSEAFEAL